MNGWGRILVALGSLSLSAVVILAFLNPAPDGYFISIWAAFPMVFWIVFVVGGVSSFAAILIGIRVRSLYFVVSGSVLVGCFNAVFFSLPRHLGLRFWAPSQSDMFNHFAFAQTVVDGDPELSGYPLLHFLVGMVSSITTLSVEDVHIPFIIVTWIIFVLGIFVLARSLFDPRFATWTLIAALPLMFGKYHYGMMPWFVSFSLIPLALAVYDHVHRADHRRNRARDSVCMLTLTLGIVFFHPMTGIILIGMVAITMGTDWIRGYWAGTKTRSAVPLRLIPILSLPFFLWFSWLGMFDRHLSTILVRLISGSEGGAESDATAAAESGYTAAQLIFRIVVHELGAVTIYVALAGLVALALIYSGVRRRSFDERLLVVGYYGTGLFLAMGMFVAYFVATNPYRINQVTILASILLIGVGLASLDKDDIHRKVPAPNVLIGIMFICLLVGATFGSFGMYDTRNHVIESEYSGSEWVLENADHDYEAISRSTALRMNAYIAGRGAMNEIGWARQPFDDGPNAVPQRLGYPEHDSVAESLEVTSERVYLATKERDRQWYQLEPESRHDQITYYTHSDMDHLRGDPKADEIYNNGRFEVWLIYDR